MAALHVRDVPPEVVDALKRRAKRNHRSLEGELRFLLETLAQAEEELAESVDPRRAAFRELTAISESGLGEPAGSVLAEPPPLDLRLSSASPASSWRREEIYGDDGR